MLFKSPGSTNVVRDTRKEVSASKRGRKGEHSFANLKPSAKLGRSQFFWVESEQSTSKEKMAIFRLSLDPFSNFFFSLPKLAFSLNNKSTHFLFLMGKHHYILAFKSKFTDFLELFCFLFFKERNPTFTVLESGKLSHLFLEMMSIFIEKGHHSVTI